MLNGTIADGVPTRTPHSLLILPISTSHTFVQVRLAPFQILSKVESRFPVDDSTLHEGEPTYTGRLAGATRPKEKQLAGATRPPGRQLAVGRQTTRCGQLFRLGSTRRRELARATAACRATSYRFPSLSEKTFLAAPNFQRGDQVFFLA